MHCPLAGVISPGQVAGVVVTSHRPVEGLRLPELHAGGGPSQKLLPGKLGGVPGGHVPGGIIIKQSAGPKVCPKNSPAGYVP
jgi:hypothetical protein